MSELSTETLTIGQQVELVEKGLKGTVAYIGTTDFASGKWVGITLNEPKGKNNGSVQGKSYFSCPENHGLFVRSAQLAIISSSPASGKSPKSAEVSPAGEPKPKSRLPVIASSINSCTNKEVVVEQAYSNISISITTVNNTISNSSSNFPALQDAQFGPLTNLDDVLFKRPSLTHINKSTQRRYSELPTPINYLKNSQTRKSPINNSNSPTMTRQQLKYYEPNKTKSPTSTSTSTSSILNSPNYNKFGRRSLSRSPAICKSKSYESMSMKYRTQAQNQVHEMNGSQINSPSTSGTSNSNDKKLTRGSTTPSLNAPPKPPRKSISQTQQNGSRQSIISTSSSSPFLNLSTNQNQKESDQSSSESMNFTFDNDFSPIMSPVMSMSSLSSPIIKNKSSLFSLEKLKYSANKLCSMRSTRLPVAGSRGETNLKDGQKSLQTTPSGSKVNLPSASPNTNTGKTTTSNIPSKRASFIETGFSESVIVPQYTPGTPSHLTTPQTPYNSEDRFNAIQTVESQKAEIKDLTEKLETLKAKRAQDQEKLRECDRYKIQVETLTEFKAKVLETQANLQRELKIAKNEAREAIEAKKRNEEESAELSETVEMATLDKEMAEEKAETLQSELDQVNENIAKLSIELETLKEQCSTGRVVLDSGEVTSVHAKQLQAENGRLMEAILKLRDASANEKHNNQRLTKDLESLKSEVKELSIAKDRYETKCLELELQVADLQDQNDAALGAEEMVENLTEKNLDLEEKVLKLNEAVSELEELQVVNDQLQESAKEIEVELREDLQNSLHNIQYLMRERDALVETVSDRDGTILRFRELVKKIQDENILLRRNLEEESSKSIPGLIENQEFKKIFAESKAQTTAIDLELRRIEAKEAKLHAQYLSTYMPEGFFTKGSDNDALLVALLIPRLINKSELLVNQVKKNLISIGVKNGEENNVPSSDSERYNFAQQFCKLLSSLLSEFQKWQNSLNTCSSEDFLNIGILYPELSIQEKAIDYHLEFFRNNQLDENVSLTGLDKCLLTFQTFYSSHLSNGNIDRPSSNDNPINARALAVKAELDQTRNLRIQLKDRDQIMNDLRKTLRAKHEELSEAQIRKELSEKKLSTNVKDSELKIEKLTRKLEDVQQILQRKEREFEAAVEHDVEYIKSLESEKGELKEKLLTAYKRTLIEGQMARSIPSTPTLQSPGGTIISKQISSISNSNIPVSEGLIEYTRHLQRQNWRMRSEKVAEIFRNLPPLDLPPKKDEELDALQKELYAINQEWQDYHCDSLRIALNPDLSDARKEYYLALNGENKRNLKGKIDILKDKINMLAVKKKSTTVVKADFKAFNVNEKEKKEDEIIKLITIDPENGDGKNKEPPRRIILDKGQLKELYDKISSIM